MTKLVLRFVISGTFLMALIAAPSFSPAFAMGGASGGGGLGGGGYPAALMRLDPPEPPSSYPSQHSTTRHLAKVSAQPVQRSASATIMRPLSSRRRRLATTTTARSPSTSV
jgi:hypothetical protein